MLSKLSLKIAFGLLIALLIGVACEKRSQTDQTEQIQDLEKPKFTNTDSLLQLQQTGVDYGEIMNQVFELEQIVKTNPLDVAARLNLLQVAVDTTRQKIYAVGEGLGDSTMASNPRIRQSVERAALVDAQRWALFIAQWQMNPRMPAITEKISGTVPPFSVVQKAELPDNKIYVMLEVTY
ncbi:hypothetical protein L0128_02325 [candidate division KSB1 bacterium]|nr:hypothetical protein [candidate division KSB1 bacterium]